MLTILQGDWIEQLRTLSDQSVQCCVTSPPYDGLRTYGFSKTSWQFEPGVHELLRVLKPGGVVCWNVGLEVVGGSESLSPFKQAIYFVEKGGFLLHDTMIYQKRNFSHPERTRYHQVFEYVFVFSKGPPLVFNPLIDRANLTAGSIGNLGVNTFTERDGSKSVREKKVTKEFGMRHNVWLGKTRGQEDMCEKLPHPAMMPKWLSRDLILSWSNVGDTVLDPFGGSGTTGMVALETGRKAILIELNPEYVKLAEQRCNVTPGFKM